MPGPPPKAPSKRSRYGTPASYGAVQPTTTPAAAHAVRELGIDNPHPLIAAMRDTAQSSCESAFYSDGDWQRLRLELWFANHTMCSGRPSGQDWAAIQRPCVDQDRRPNPGEHRQLLQPN